MNPKSGRRKRDIWGTRDLIWVGFVDWMGLM